METKPKSLQPDITVMSQEEIMTLKLNFTLKVKVNHPQKHEDLDQGLLHIWSKFGDPSLNGWWVIMRTSPWLMHGQTHRQTQATTIPKGQNWPRLKTNEKILFTVFSSLDLSQYMHMLHKTVSFILLPWITNYKHWTNFNGHLTKPQLNVRTWNRKCIHCFMWV